MVKCSLSEAEWFDILAIYNVKVLNCSGEKKQKNIQNFKNLSIELKEQIGDFKFNEIISSDEYKNLVSINTKVFNLVDLAVDGLAKETRDGNFERYLAKLELQTKYFPNNSVVEIKTN